MLFRLLTSLLISTILTTTLHAEDSATVTQPPADETSTKDTSNETREAKLFFDEAFDDYQQELTIAKENGKQGILIMYEMENCPFCARMKATVLNHGNIQDYFHKNFRIMSVDIDGDIEITNFKGDSTTQKDFSLKNRVRATPVFQFFDLDGKPLKNGKLTGATKNKDEFLLLGKFIASKENEKQSFSRYKRALKVSVDASSDQ